MIMLNELSFNDEFDLLLTKISTDAGERSGEEGRAVCSVTRSITLLPFPVSHFNYHFIDSLHINPFPSLFEF